MKPQRKPATQSRPPKAPLGQAAGGMGARSVGSPAGGRRTAAVFSSLGAAATISILARDRHRDNGEVRRLGFAPIPGRRSTSQQEFKRSGQTPCSQRERRATPLGTVREQQRNTLGVTVGREPTTNSDPGASRGERAAWTGHAGYCEPLIKNRPLNRKVESASPVKPGKAPGCACAGVARAGIESGRARILSAPPSRRLGAGRVSSGKHSARPTPFSLASGE